MRMHDHYLFGNCGEYKFFRLQVYAKRIDINSA